MREGGSTLSSFKAAIIALAEQVLAVDIRAYESMPPDRLANELQPVAATLLRSAHDLVHAMHLAHEAGGWERASSPAPLPSPYVAFEQAIDAAIDAPVGSPLQAVGDIAFLAHLELRQRLDRLERVSTCRSAEVIVGECDSALRRVRKALTSIDLAMARAGIAPASLDFTSELEVSLQVRRACAKLRRRVLAGGAPARDTLRARLRSAGTAIAMLVGWEVYPTLRVRDRLQLRDLQRRILESLRLDGDPSSGLRLWQDLDGFLGMLTQVNRRQELVDHDARVVAEVAERMGWLDGAELDDGLLGLLASLEGLDDQVDELLGSPQRRDAAAWAEHVDRLARQLRVGKGAT